ncbi:uncharacterized protein SEPMUDRAFT_119562 [Sphaerulina musiva SO2202]|uniref:Uncharacterized protein n=1 Tax=Sphaerulina musiva (strain SO2202) TaxID=692275 RepID=M3AUS6_SPHMS|nr:uncharacterized protein SEPMUDRAFT_119562 [Sphaerulina musiva SO2202]EMF09821.1 hypothetical protein SEPMUDRAFT_119562 [Sphaerulina musiva SO2202]
MATTTRSFPPSTTTQHNVDPWQAGRGQRRVYPPSRFSRFDETSSAARRIHQTSSVPKSTHRHDFSGSSPSVPVLRLKTAQEPRAPDAQPPTRTIHHQKSHPLRQLISSRSRPPSHPAVASQVRPQNLVHFASLSVQPAVRRRVSLRGRKPLLALLNEIADRSRLLGVRETLVGFETIWTDGIGIRKDMGAEGDIRGRNGRGRFGGDNGKMLRRR